MKNNHCLTEENLNEASGGVDTSTITSGKYDAINYEKGAALMIQGKKYRRTSRGKTKFKNSSGWNNFDRVWGRQPKPKLATLLTSMDQAYILKNS